jgi:hypothetical protein
MFPKERIENLYVDEFSPLLEFHGMWIIPGSEVEFESKMPSALGDGNIIRMDGRFWVDEELTDDYSVVIRQEEVANEEDMQKVVAEFLGKTFGALASSLDEEAKDEIDAAIANMEIKTKKGYGPGGSPGHRLAASIRHRYHRRRQERRYHAAASVVQERENHSRRRGRIAPALQK